MLSGYNPTTTPDSPSQLQRMFKGAQNLIFQGGSFVSADKAGLTGLQLLYQRIAHGATHDSAERFPPPKCHPKTRKAIVNAMEVWANNLPRTFDVIWLEGPAGAGKTAIAQTFCELILKARQLAGSFFLARTVHGRNNPQYLFATIAYQLAIAVPEVGERIEEAIASDPSIMTKSIDLQLQKLIIEPLLRIDLGGRTMIIVIDGLDECEGENMQCHILHLIGSIFQQGTFPISFVISSRPEPWIRDVFDSDVFSRITQHISLDQSSEADEDIRTYLEFGFAEILNNPKYRWSMANISLPWPSQEDLDCLIEKSSGQFIYPATVLKFVDDPNFRPVDRLKVIIEIPAVHSRTLNPFEDLDRLYTQILSTSSDNERTLLVLGTLITMMNSDGLHFEWRLTSTLLDVAEQLLGLQPHDGYLALRNIHSLVHVPESICSWLESLTKEQLTWDSYDQVGVKFHHKSFIDFLRNESRSKTFYVDDQVIHRCLASACMETLKNLSLHPASRLRFVTWGYAVLHWAFHETHAGPPTAERIRILKEFDLFNCFILVLQLKDYDGKLDTIQRVVYPPETYWKAKLTFHTKRERVFLHPIASDVYDAGVFMLNIGAQNDLITSHFREFHKWIASWLRQYEKPPRKLIREYQVVADILAYYGTRAKRRPQVTDLDKYFLRNVPRHPLVEKWHKIRGRFNNSSATRDIQI